MTIETLFDEYFWVWHNF